jgi:arylsulfatase A-like enzyme
MEPHGPYYPGLQRASEVGLLDSYRSIFSFQKHGDETPSHHIKTQRRLYEQCVKKVDESLEKLFNFADSNAGIVLLGDHGEEFEHGHYDHERLYDECVRVPFFSKNVFDTDVPDTVRQIDVPVELLEHTGIEIPRAWDGSRFAEDPTTFMISPWPADGTFQCAVRTSEKKYLRTYDRESGEIVRQEYYDIEEDPNEMTNLYDTTNSTPLQTKVDEFMESNKDALRMDPQTEDTSEAVKDRLKNLGYK